MRALLASELRRATSRRLVRLAVVGALTGIAVGGVLTAVHSNSPTETELANARAEYRASLQRCLSGHQIQPSQLPRGISLEPFCHDSVRIQYYLPSDSFNLSGLPDILSHTSILVILGALLIGASLTGAEWHAGTMTTLLTWEPRRMRVLAVKATVAVAVIATLAVVLFTVLSFVLWLVAATRGFTGGIEGAFVRSVVSVILRASAAASVAGIVGLAIAMLGRSTTAALGIGFAYLGVLEGLIRGLRPNLQPWLFGDNMAIFVNGQSQVLDLGKGREVVRTVGFAAVVVGTYAALLLAAAAASFRARDVT